MLREVTNIIENARHLNYAVSAAAIKKEVPGLLHRLAAHSVSTQFEVKGARAFTHYLRAFLRARPFWVVANIANGLFDQISITRGRNGAEFPLAPSQNIADILASGGR